MRKAASIRIAAVEAISAAGSGHPGGSLSVADLLAYLYFHEMRINPSQPDWPDRDRLILSKGHAAPAYYAALAARGYFEISEMKQLRQVSSFLQGHPDMNKVPGVDMSTGSLGQGLSAANGMALAGKATGRDYRVFCIIGDGETQEGQIWEAVMTAAHYRLNNLIVFLDQNGLQIDGPVETVMNNTPYQEKFKAFGWNVISIGGHDFNQIEHGVQQAKQCAGKPTMLICNTVKGKGVSFMENVCGWHGTAPDPGQKDRAVAELTSALTKAG